MALKDHGLAGPTHLVMLPQPHDVIGELEMNPLQPQILSWGTDGQM